MFGSGRSSNKLIGLGWGRGQLRKSGANTEQTLFTTSHQAQLRHACTLCASLLHVVYPWNLHFTRLEVQLTLHRSQCAVCNYIFRSTLHKTG